MPEGQQTSADASSSAEGVYLFCMARLPLPELLSEHGLEPDRPLRTWSYRDLAAIGSVVPLDPFCGPRAEDLFQDVNWIGPRALQHQRIILDVMGHSPVLPCRFGTLFSSPAPLMALLRCHYHPMARFLQSMSDKEEWAVKGYLDPAKAESWLTSSKPELAARRQALAESPGKRYLQEKQLSAEVQRQVRHWARAETHALAGLLSKWTECIRPMRLLAAVAAGSECLFHHSVLIRREQVSDFQSYFMQLDALYHERGLRIELSGPWPPYSFSPSFSSNAEPVSEVPRLLHTL